MSIRIGASRLASPILVAVAVLTASAAAGADAKLGYINSDRIFAEYKGVEDLKRSFDQQVGAWEKERVASRSELDSLMSEFKSQELMLTESMKRRSAS
jgi:Skp family chaperone for outer membrane proteins